VTAHVPPEVWRARCVEMAESGLGMRQWAESRGINPRTLGAYVTRLRKEEPELLSSEASWCPCPLMRKLRPCADAEARGFLKRVYFEASPPPSAEKGASEENEFRSSILGVVMRRIGPTPTRPDVSSAFLHAMVEDGSQPSLAALKATVLAAAGTGFHDGDPIFAWAAENEESLRRKNGGTRLLLMAMESDNLLQVRAIKTIKSGDRSSPFTPTRSSRSEAHSSRSRSSRRALTATRVPSPRRSRRSFSGPTPSRPPSPTWLSLPPRFPAARLRCSSLRRPLPA